MIPIRFSESNTVMCSAVHAFADGQHIITCWQPTPEERTKIAIGEPVWLLLVGPTMQPALLTADRPPFVE